MFKIIIIVICIVVLLFGFVVFRGAPYVPSKRRDIKRAFTALYPLGSSDVLVDIGSGDGVVLRAAAKQGARAVGYELNPILVLLSRWLSRKYTAITIKLADFWLTSLPSDVTVVYVFGESRDINKMAKKVAREAVKQGRSIAFISYGFTLRDAVPVKTVGPHHLYRFDPLQSKEA